MRSTVSRCLLLIMALPVLFAASCGGAGTAGLIADPTGSAETAGAGSVTGSGQTANTNDLFAGLPAIPLDTGNARLGSLADDPEQNITLLGKDFLQMQGGTVDGDALALASKAAEPGERPQLAYGLYQVNGLGDGRPLSLNVECLPGEFGDGYFIGLANYTQARWTWFGPVKLPEFQLDLSKRDHRFVTQLGNLYFILVCPPETSITHKQTTVVMGAVGSGGGIPPGVGHGLRASDGGFDHQIQVAWEPGAGAAQYEVWRRPAFEGSKWELRGSVPANHFTDNQLPNNRYFFYRVRAVNPQGPAEFSGVDSGWAGLAAPRDIAGQITAESGAPLAGVPVELSGFGPDMTRVTNADGRYVIQGLAPGHYAVTPLPRDIDFEPGFRIADLTNQSQAELNFTAHPAHAGGVVWGFVLTPNLNPDGNGDFLLPVPGASVTLKDMDEPGHELTTTTNEAGFYAFVNLPFGPFQVAAAKTGLNFVPKEQPVGLGPQNTRERRSFIALPPPGGNGGDPGQGGDPPPPGGDPPPPGGGEPPAGNDPA